MCRASQLETFSHFRSPPKKGDGWASCWIQVKSFANIWIHFGKQQHFCRVSGKHYRVEQFLNHDQFMFVHFLTPHCHFEMSQLFHSLNLWLGNYKSWIIFTLLRDWNSEYLDTFQFLSTMKWFIPNSWRSTWPLISGQWLKSWSL